MKLYFDSGVLVLPKWRFSGKDARVPHRSHVLAECQIGREHFYVEANHRETLFWVHAVGPGFAGDRSRSSLTCATRNQDIAMSWLDAVRHARVRISES